MLSQFSCNVHRQGLCTALHRLVEFSLKPSSERGLNKVGAWNGTHRLVTLNDPKDETRQTRTTTVPFSFSRVDGSIVVVGGHLDDGRVPVVKGAWCTMSVEGILQLEGIKDNRNPLRPLSNCCCAPDCQLSGCPAQLSPKWAMWVYETKHGFTPDFGEIGGTARVSDSHCRLL